MRPDCQYVCRASTPFVHISSFVHLSSTFRPPFVHLLCTVRAHFVHLSSTFRPPCVHRLSMCVRLSSTHHRCFAGMGVTRCISTTNRFQVSMSCDKSRNSNPNCSSQRHAEYVKFKSQREHLIDPKDAERSTSTLNHQHS